VSYTDNDRKSQYIWTDKTARSTEPCLTVSVYNNLQTWTMQEGLSPY